MAELNHFIGQEFLSLETFRKTGVGVKSPMWFAQDGDALYLWTNGESAKVRRIRNNPQVNIAPCTRFGAVTGEWVAAQASIDDSAATLQHIEKLLGKKLGFGYAIFRFIDGVRDRSRGSHRVCVKVSLI